MDIFSPALMPFTIAIMAMLVIMVAEFIGLMFGAAMSDLLDGALPDVDVDIDADGLDASDSLEAGFISQFFGWLSVGKVPVLMLLVIFLTAFGLIGLIGQSTLQNILGFYLPPLLMALPAFAGAIFATRYCGLGLARIMPKEETDAVSSDTFIGQVAEILRGEAKIDMPAEAKLKDVKGTTQYILVEPDEGGVVFRSGDTVLLVEKRGAVFRAIANTNSALAQE